jgi:hypothetical protein
MLLTSVVFVFDTAADMLRNRKSVSPRRYLTLPAEPE